MQNQVDESSRWQRHLHQVRSARQTQ